MQSDDQREIEDIQQELVTAIEPARLYYALLLARWYCAERDTAEYYRRQSELYEYQSSQWQICACIWASVGILACTAVLVLIVRG